MRRTLFEKLWDAHTIEDLGGGWSLLHVDRNLMHDLSVQMHFATSARAAFPCSIPNW
jgi:3-isopropylmalate/(R)-2-methylmalate dehydratase large subunit